MNRREFLGMTSGLLAAASLPLVSGAFAATTRAVDASEWNPEKGLVNPGKPLRIQPLLMYATPTRREQTSWKSWGGVQSDAAAEEEAARIMGELKSLSEKSDFPFEALPIVKATTPEQAQAAHQTDHDAILLFPATGSRSLLEASFSPKGSTIIFVRHRSGPVYYWYEALSTRILAADPSKAKEGSDKPAVGVEDVVVDDPAELLWRLRALYAVKNVRESRVIALGGAAGKYAGDAPEIARNNYGMEIIDIAYPEIEGRIKAMLEDSALNRVAEAWTDRYLALPGTTLNTERPFVTKSFLLYVLFKDLMAERKASAFTINSCMGTIMPMSETTACLTLSLMNDEGQVAFCESDFVVIPAGILLRYTSGKPVFMHNSTFPHKGMVTCAHCTSPRRLDGSRYEPTLLVTHYESEYGAAPKVDMPKGQPLTFISPEYTSGRWVGFRGHVESNPFYEICRSQQDVLIEGNWKKLLGEIRDSHWMTAYGDCLEETGYAARKLGIRWETLETPAGA